MPTFLCAGCKDIFAAKNLLDEHVHEKGPPHGPRAEVVGKAPPAAPQADGGFDAPTSALAQLQDNAGALAVVTREAEELRSAIIVAKKFPRSEANAAAKLLRSCDRASFAEEATYAFPRGTATVEGPSVSMAREAARCWGNIQYGIRIISEDEERIHIKGWAVDLETNNRVEIEDKSGQSR